MSKIIYTIFDNPNNLTAIEQTCYDSWKRVYPDFIVMNLNNIDEYYTLNGNGLFLAHDIYAVYRISDEYFNNPFISWDTEFETTNISNKIMFGITEPFTPPSNLPKIECSTNDYMYKGVRIISRKTFGGSDFRLYQVNDGEHLFIDIGLDKLKSIPKDSAVSTLIIDNDSNPQYIADRIDDFIDSKGYKYGTFLIILNKVDCGDNIVNRITPKLIYNTAELRKSKKDWELINIGGICKPKEIILDYITRKSDF